MVGAALNERGIAASDGSEFYPTLGFRVEQSLVLHQGQRKLYPAQRNSHFSGSKKAQLTSTLASIWGYYDGSDGIPKTREHGGPLP
jgi:hypothetical protein